MQNIRKVSGVSLIEILVTTLVLGIGLLGVAALQVSSLSSNQEGFFTSQASSIARDYASRVRASGRMITAVPESDDTTTAVVQHINYLATYATGGALACGTSPGTMCRSDNGASPAACDEATMKLFDQWEVCDVAKNTLPDGKLRAIQTGNRLTIVVDWDSTQARTDLGQKQNVNTNCAVLTGSAERNCVIVELVP